MEKKSDRGQRVWETSKPFHFIVNVVFFDTFDSFSFVFVCVRNVMTFHTSKCLLHMEYFLIDQTESHSGREGRLQKLYL